MKQLIIIGFIFIGLTKVLGQEIPRKYFDLVKTADSLYKIKDFTNSAKYYSEAFRSNGWKGMSDDRYNAACSWSLANKPDSAFFNLFKIANLMGYQNYNHIIKDTDLEPLHNDKRWNSLIEIVKQNKEKAEEKLNKPLIKQLDSIYNEDQTYRKQIGDIEKKYGRDSKEMKAHWKIISEKDSINLIQVKAILDKYGWLGPDVIGVQGNSTLFLVIQHSEQTTQEKYLPMLKDAVKNGKAQGSSLALLEDRVALGQGKKQIYGSQIGRNNETGKFYVLPLEDPDNVDKRRASVNLKPLAEYVKNWQIDWDVEKYKKDLPKLEEEINKSKNK
jgi:hypothetical protein